MFRTKIQKNGAFELDATFNCGQCFRFNGDENGVFSGVAYGKSARFTDGGDFIYLDCQSEDDFEFWLDFLDYDRDYCCVVERACNNELLYKIANYGRGIRILRQEPWEALCSFIISQNNNIPRIKGIIERLCELCGDRLPSGEFSFPSAQRVASFSVQELQVLRAGFRARYIIDAAQKVSSGEIDLERLKSIPYDDAKAILKTICGVGDKVANCVLLFGLGHINAFPVDVWIKRIMQSKFPSGLPECVGNEKGIFQQYLFYYYRSHPEELD